MNSSFEELIQAYISGDEFTELLQEFIQNQDDEEDTSIDISDFGVQLYTPGSDLAPANQQNQLTAGRDGNDIFIGFNPVADNPEEVQVDVFLGDGEVPGIELEESNQREWIDRFTLGDWTQPYYVNNGSNDFAVILDFNPSKDIIQLYGTSEDYQLVESSLGTEIQWQQENSSDLIAVLPSVSDLSLESDYFQFEGDTPATGPVFGQTQQIGTADYDILVGVDTDASGNVYVAGGTTGSLGEPNAGGRDGWVAKYDSEGNQEWIQQVGSSSFDTIYNIATDKEGNSYVTGTTEGDLEETRQASISDVWVAKYDSDGNQEWIEQFGNDTINLAFDIDVDDEGDVYQSGLTFESFEDDSWVTKYDSDGDRQWFSEFGDPVAFDEAYGVAFDSNGNVYASGWTLGNLEGDNAGIYDVWVTKYDSEGNQEWIQQFGSEDYEFSWDIASDSEGNSYATGWTLGDLGGENAGGYDAWVAKYDSEGNQEWIQQFGSSGDDEGFGVEVGLDGNIFVTGYTDGDLQGTNAGKKDAWVAKYDSSGNQEWIQQFGTPGSDFSYAVSIDNADNLFVTGATEGSFGDINAGSWDAWIAKLDSESAGLLDFAGTT